MIKVKLLHNDEPNIVNNIFLYAEKLNTSVGGTINVVVFVYFEWWTR